MVKFLSDIFACAIIFAATAASSHESQPCLGLVKNAGDNLKVIRSGDLTGLDLARIMTIEIFLAANVCWYSKPLSSVRNTSKRVSANANSSPFCLPAKPASGAVRHSCSKAIRLNLNFFGTHSSMRTLTVVAPTRGIWPLPGRRWRPHD